MNTPPIVVPAPTFRTSTGELDLDTTCRYATRITKTWTPHVIVSGPMGVGEDATVSERTAILDVWLRHVEPARLIAACWATEDVQTAHDRGVRPLVMLRAATVDDLVDQLDVAPADSWVYANPRYSNAILTPELLSTAAVAGVKLSKVTVDDLSAMRTDNPHAVIVHGSSRNITASLASGVDLVTAPPLTALPTPWPAPDLDAIQGSVNAIQPVLDDLPTHRSRVEYLTAQAVSKVSS